MADDRETYFVVELVRVPVGSTDIGSTLDELAGQTLQDLSGTPLSEL